MADKGDQTPIFHHTPVKPTRQPSRMVHQRAFNNPYDQQQQQQSDGTSYYPESHSPYQNQQPTYSQPSLSSPRRRPTNMPNPYETPAYDPPAQPSPARSPDYGVIRAQPSFNDQSSGLRQRSGDSISRNHGGGSNNFNAQDPYQTNNYDTGIGSSLSLPHHQTGGHHQQSPYGMTGQMANYSNPSLYSQNQEEKQDWASSHVQMPTTDGGYHHDNDSMMHVANKSAYPDANNGFYPPREQSYDQYGRPVLPYANDSEAHLTQSDSHNGAYETIHMNGMQPMDNYNNSSSYNYNNNGFPSPYSGDGFNQKPEGDFVGGWVGIAAPGTMIANPLQRSAYMPNHDSGGYENARQRLLRRRTVKKIALTNGNLVLDIPVPRSICKAAQGEEFRTMRYSAATCDPNDWTADRFTLRPFLMKREIELAICMTCYNEDEALLYRTLGSVIRNIGYLQSRTRSKVWGANSWKKVVVFIVGDGRKKANERMLKMLSCYGIFQEGAMKDHVLDKEVTGHIFELTTQVIVDPQGGIKVSDCPIQLVFCLKEKNQKKINSHRWFFNAFCQQLQPNVTILLDVGTMPTDRSLYHLWKAFDKNKKVAGACGEIAVDVGSFGWRLYNPLVAAQNFEYKMSNILDKPLESVFGFIGVLPGAFSAYRWQALKGRPLEAYFKGEQLHNGQLEGGSFVNNLYLAEDRILCFELVVKSREPWILKYVKSAKATTDVPDGVAELIAQRRRWLNGSLFATMFALIHFARIWTSGQSFLRKCALQLQVIYNLVQLAFTWTSLANWYLASYFLMQSATSDPTHDPFAGQGKAVLDIVLNVYIALVVVVVVASLGSRPQGFRAMYLGCILLFAGLFALILYCVGWTLYVQLNQVGLFTTSGWTTSHIIHLLVTSSNIRSIVISVVATYVLYLLSSLWMLDPWHMLTSFVQYMFLTPFFITVLSIYSLANLHDVSWGTKGSDAASSDLGSASGGKDKSKEGKQMVEVKVPTSSADADELWQHAQADLAQKIVEQKQHRSKSVKQTDHQQNFRTQFLLFWLGSNAALIIIFTSNFWLRFTKDDLHLSTNPYLAVLFWSTAALSAIRALGSLIYLVFRMFGH